MPWFHQTVTGRIDELQQAQKKLEETWPAYPNEDQSASMRTQYSKVRATIERAVQDIVFNGVVNRYRDWIKIGNLKQVVGFDASECAEIERLHKICCEIIDGHDSSSAKNAPVPTASELRSVISELDTIVKRIKARQNKKK